MRKLSLTAIHIVFIILTIIFLFPFVMVVIMSISNEDEIVRYGFQIIPSKIDFTAFKFLFDDFSQMGRSMILTAIISVVAPFCSCLAQSFIAYPLSRKDYVFRKPILYFVMFTMIFSGGTIPTYVFMTKYYNLGNNPLLYIVTAMVSAWGILLFKTFFSGIPESLIEAADIDGASQVRIIWSIVVPMSKSIFAIQFFTRAINKWNDFETSLLYMTDKKWFTIQFFMQRILEDATQLKQAYAQSSVALDMELPLTALRYAMCIISVLPVLILFPFIQKYFSKGIAVGAVKE